MRNAPVDIKIDYRVRLFGSFSQYVIDGEIIASGKKIIPRGKTRSVIFFHTSVTGEMPKCVRITLSCFRVIKAPTDESPPLFWDKTHIFHGNGKQKSFFSEYGGWVKNAGSALPFREKCRIIHVTEGGEALNLAQDIGDRDDGKIEEVLRIFGNLLDT